MVIRPLRPDEYCLLDDFLYLAIHVPPGEEPPPRNITTAPELVHNVDGFGSQPGDIAFAAVQEDRIIGIAWSRILDGDPPGYGNIGADIPEVTIAVVPEARGQGIGAALLEALLHTLAGEGYEQVSLSVQKTNRAARLYSRLGFVTARDNAEDLVLVKPLINT